MARSTRPSQLRMVLIIVASLAAVLWIHHDLPQRRQTAGVVDAQLARLCQDRLIYIYQLPDDFNKAILDKCYKLQDERNNDRCSQLAGWGFGKPFTKHELKPLQASSSSSSSKAWWATDPHSLELIFHRRMLLHPCVTQDWQEATLFYLPVYPGLEMEHTLQLSQEERDALGLKLAAFLRQQPPFQRYQGADHFFVLGQPTWKFRRDDRMNDTWGSNLEYVPEIDQMMKLEVERHPYTPGNSMGIPFPTDFHPLTTKQVRRWQAHVRRTKRPFSFAVVIPEDRGGNPAAVTTRQAAVSQCLASPACRLLNCTSGCSHSAVLDTFLTSKYAVQDGGPHGLRLLLDSMVAGAVPIVLWDITFNQYRRHFPDDADSFSVYLPHEDLPEWTTVEHRLTKVNDERYDRMHETIVRMVPTLIYTDPEHHLARIQDAFDVSLNGLFLNVTNFKSLAATNSSQIAPLEE